MARLSRFTQLIFGSTAGTNEMSEFGSKAAGTPMRFSGATITPAIVQTLSQYLSGWKSAVLGSYSPAIEDMNALFFLYAFQLAYIFQSGIPEWDSATVYYTGSLVQDSTGIVYVSITNNNVGNSLSDFTNWFSPTHVGLLNQNALPASMTMPANKTMVWPNLSIANAQTVTVPSGAYLVGITSITTTGTGNLTITGTGIVRVL